MCSGAILLYNIPKVVIGENTTLMGAECLLEKWCRSGSLNNLECKNCLKNMWKKTLNLGIMNYPK